MSQSIGRTMSTVSAVTFVSRVLGLLRNVVLAAAIGSSVVADSYNFANNIPNMLFILLGGGMIAAVFVPQLVRVSEQDPERGDALANVLLSWSAVVGLLMTVVLTLVVGWAAAQLSGGDDPQTVRLLTYLCMPQVFFYVVFAIVSQLLNARESYVAAAWAPLANSAIVIATAVPIIVAQAVDPNRLSSLTGRDLLLLGGGTLLGTASQSLIVVVWLRRSGHRFRFRLGGRGFGLRASGRIALLTILTAGLYQGSNLVVASLATRVGTSGADGRGYSAYFYALSIVFVAQAVASGGLAAILLRRLSAHFQRGDDAAAQSEFGESVRRLTSGLIPLAGALAVAGPFVGVLLFHRGGTSFDDARFIGWLISIFAAGLIPLTVHILLLRPFYADGDALTPLRSSLTVTLVCVALSFLAVSLLDRSWATVGLSVAFVLGYLIDLPLKLRRLRRFDRFAQMDPVLRPLLRPFVVALVLVLVLGGVTVTLVTLTGDDLLPTYGAAVALPLGYLVCYHLCTRRSPHSLVAALRWLRR